MTTASGHSFSAGIRKGWQIASDPDPTALSRRRQEYLNRDLLAESWELTGAQLNEAMNQAQLNDLMSWAQPEEAMDEQASHQARSQRPT